MSLPEPFRGEVWDVDFDDFGLHPAVVLSINALNIRLGHVAVVPITGTPGPDQTHVPLGPDAGLTRYPESFADVTALQPVARSRLLERRGLLAMAEADRLGRQLTTYLGLDPAPRGTSR
jgi:mRNA interferase MazF